MKSVITLVICFFAFFSFSQLNKKVVEKKDGTYIYCYHKNGKIASEEFLSNTPSYIDGGYTKVFNQKGEVIYTKNTSRRGMVSSVRLSYYPTGAVQSAYYSSHPDAGIQWHNETTSFDENGIVTNVVSSSWDDRVTMTTTTPNDSLYRKKQKEEELKRLKDLEEKQKQIREKEKTDSLNFYLDTSIVNADGTFVEHEAHPKDGYCKKIVFSKSERVIEVDTEYYKKETGVYRIQRFYHKNQRLSEETIYDNLFWHYRKFNKKGQLVEEKINQKY